VRCHLRLCPALQPDIVFENARESLFERSLLITIYQPHFAGKVARLPWSFKPEQSKGVYIFRTNDEDSGEVVWQIGIGHGDTKTKPRRMIISDVDGEQIKVISPKGFCCPLQIHDLCWIM
jgi:hypothetical protein